MLIQNQEGTTSALSHYLEMATLHLSFFRLIKGEI